MIRQLELKRFAIWFVLLLLLIPVTVRLWQQPFFGTDDGYFHLVRLFELDRGLEQGQIYPRVAPDLYFGYGYPLYNFYPPLTYYLTLSFHALGMSLLDALRMTYTVCILIAGFGMFVLARDLYGSISTRTFLGDLGALVAAVAYSYSYYFLLDIYLRGAVAETLGMALLPWAIWALRRVLYSRAMIAIVLASLLSAMLLLSHNLTTYFAVPIVGGLLLLEAWFLGGWRERLAGVGRLIGASALGLVMACFYWLPAVTEISWVYIGSSEFAPEALLNSIRVHQVYANQLVQWGWPYLIGLFPFPRGVTFPPLLLATALLGVVSTWRILDWAARRWALYLFAIGCVLTFALTKESIGIWERLPFAWFIQFPWRLSVFIDLVLVLFSGLLVFTFQALIDSQLFQRLMSKLARGRLTLSLASRLSLLALVGVLILSLLSNALGDLNPPMWFVSTDDLNLGTVARREVNQRLPGAGFFTSVYAEYLPLAVTGIPFPELRLRKSADTTRTDNDIAAMRLESVSDERWVVHVNTPKAFPLKLRQFYYPDWSAQVDGAPVPAFPSGANGLVTVEVPAGEHLVVFQRAPIPTRTLGLVISGIGLLVWIGLIVIALRQDIRTGIWGAVCLVGVCLLILLPHTAGLDAVSEPVVPASNTGTNQTSSGVDVNESLRVLGYASEELADRLVLALYWQVKRQVTAEIPLTVELVNGENRAAATRTSFSRYGTGWMVNWLADEIAPDLYDIPLAGVAPGTYQVRVKFQDQTEPVQIGSVELHDSHAPLPPRESGDKIAQFGDNIELLSLKTDAPEMVTAGDRLRFDLEWRATSDVVYDYTFSFQWVDQFGNVAAQRDIMARGSLVPTSQWFPNQTLLDQQELFLPKEMPPGIYRLILFLVRGNPPARLPVVEGNVENEDFVELATFHVRPGAPQRPPDVPRSVKFGSSIELDGHELAFLSPELDVVENRPLELSATQPYTAYLKVHWRRSEEPAPLKDSTVFVHFVNEAGELVAQQDNPPVKGIYPTSIWQPGDVVTDPYEIPLPQLPPGVYRVLVGMYEPDTGNRLEVVDSSGAPTPDSQIELERFTVPP